jgi:2-dehydro-3-deoxyphosphogluconate aldolase / (4S)-4-hydroxy-2-oxoglutarate aldolase
MFYWSGRLIRKHQTIGSAGGKKDTMNDTRLVVHHQSNETSEKVGRPSPFTFPVAATLEKHEIRACIEDTGVVPNATIANLEDAAFLAETLTQGGVPIIEISLNSPDALEIVDYLTKHAPTTIVGAGGVRSVNVAQKCVDSGARFISTDGMIPGVVKFAAKQNVVTIQGALTLTEVISTCDAGADFVKIVPCYTVGGPNYIRTLKATVPQARLIAAGGVNQLTALKYVMAGALALSIGSELVPEEAVALRQAGRIQELARRFLTAVDGGRT